MAGREISIRSSSAVIAAGLALWLSACGEEVQAPEPIIRPVRTQPVYTTGGERSRAFSGTAQAALESKLSFKVSGTVEAVLVQVGDRVKSGKLIANLDDRDYRLRVQEAEARLASAQAPARNAEANYSRVRALWENRNASQNDLDAARAASLSARANVESIAKRLELSEMQLGYTRLSAQVDGAIAEVRVDPNENVSPGQTVVVLTSGAQLEVEVGMPEVLISQVREGDAVEVEFKAISGKTFGARVTEVGVISTQTATTFPVTVRLDHADADCRPGMAADVTFTFGGQSGREHIYVPSVAVANDRKGHYVYVAEASGDGFAKVVRREVKVGVGPVQEGLEIIEGLSDGDLVVTAGVSRIVDGQKVRLLETK